jgi:serine/threonine protein phosphatase PrpC
MNYNIATASVIGSSHRKLFYNNQDAYEYYQDKNIIIGVVADGCGSGSNSEVGARLGVNFVVNFCKKHFQNSPFDAEILKNGLVDHLKILIKNQQTDEELDFIENYLFFTLFGFVIQADQTYIFHSGDGMYQLNEKVVLIEQDNRPNYIAKNLISGKAKIEVEMIETDKLERLLVATDGLTHLNDKFLNDETIDNMTQISDIFDNDDYFEDMIALPKYLTDLSVNRNILKDDTTLIMLKNTIKT